MTYEKGELIEAEDYNNFLNQLFTFYADTNSGTTNPLYVDFGYGQSTSTLLPVPIGELITHIEWTTLFTAINNVGVHQGTSTSGLPWSVNQGDIIFAENAP